MPRILVFGASITYGAWDTQGGWVQRLRSYTDQKELADPSYFSRVYNLGISGDTTVDLLQRMDREIQPRIGNDGESLFLISIGANDSQCITSSRKNIFTITQFKDNIKQIIGIAKKYSEQVVLVGLTPVDEKKVDPKPWDTKQSYLNKYIEQYNSIEKIACQECDVYFIDIYEDLYKVDYSGLLEDGIHPNNQGHEKIFEIVKKFLEKEELI